MQTPVTPTGRHGGKDNLEDIVENIMQAYYPTARFVYSDDFSNGSLNGWREQYDSSSPGRVGLTLTDEARLGAYGLLLHSRPAANDEAWMRKGVSVPDGVKKVIKGCYFMWHAANVNSPASLKFDFDYQMGTGTNTGNNRRYWSVRYSNYSGALQQKWQMQTGTPTAQAWTDVTDGYMPVGWNESEKPLLCYMVAVFDIASQTYEALYANGLEFNLSTQSVGPTAGASLANYDKGAIDINAVVNRNDSSEDCQFIIEKPFLAYVF